MEEFTSIPKNIKLPQGQDYEFLRSEGLKHIENLASALWTDYNAHDPGITILEALCYAITELNYRCGFDIKDFLHTENGTLVSGQTLFTAKEILTISPVTIDDFRKLLIDIDGVHNAWLFADDFSLIKKNNIPVNEIEIFADCKNDKLTFDKKGDALFLSGLYKVYLDLDYDDRYGDLNNGVIFFPNPVATGFSEGEFYFEMDFLSKKIEFELIENATDQSQILSLEINPLGDQFKFIVQLTDANIIEIDVSIPQKPASKTVTKEFIEEMFGVTADPLTLKKEKIAAFFTFLLEKISKVRSIILKATQSLHAHRNLCEDYLTITTVDDDKISFCFDVDVQPSADIEKVEAEIFYAIENYLNPYVDFYSLKELLDKKIPVDEIFSGPILKHGFIDTEQLEQTNLRSEIHASDIINLLMDIEGVTGIRNFLMRKDIDEKTFITEKWCMHVEPLHKPVLNTEKSKIVLFKNNFPFTAHYEEVRDTVLVLHAIRTRAKLKGLEDDLAIPTGNNRDTESYYPLQYDFPQTYGIGEFGLPSGATQLRTAQQRQLKAYLMFYEQLLADFLSQLTNAHELLSVNDLKHTYYAQFLNGIKDMKDVYKTSVAPDPDLQKVIVHADSTPDERNGWQSLYEPKNIFEDRRSRFLHHLLSRFAESFNDYALLMYNINYEKRTQDKISFNELTESKTETLKHYPEISSERGKAFNYFPLKFEEATNQFTPDISKYWDSDNVSGLEKRISFLTGLKNYKRRFLSCIRNIQWECVEEKNADDQIECKIFFILTFFEWDEVTTKLTEYKIMSGKFISKDEGEQALTDAIANNNFDSVFTEIIKTTGFEDHSLNDELINDPASELFNTVKEKIAALIATECSEVKGMHLIEHILLRPRDEKFDLIEVCLHDCECLCELDPYSFRATVVLPSQAAHFGNMTFRNYFENKIREEAPAHVMLKICWLGNELMQEFEIIYKNWIEKLAAWSFDKEANEVAFRTANNLMIEVLAKLHSEYPLANLHNCDESKEGSNTVQLGKTVLGTFKNL